MGIPFFKLGAVGAGGLYGLSNLDETPITYDTNRRVDNYTSPSAYRNYDLTQTAVRHPASGYIDEQGNQVLNPPYYVDDNGQVQFITEPPTYTNYADNPVNSYNESVAGGGGAMGRNAVNNMSTTATMDNSANGISAVDLAALAKQAQATPDYAAIATEQMSTMPTHTMPDGTVHPGATHADYLAMQQQQAQDAMTRGMNAYNQIDPGMKEAADTDRKRDRTSFGEMLLSRMNQAEPGMLTPAEKMIRTGSAIVGASGQGGLAAMEAAGQSYGAIQDYERAQRQQQIENELDLQTKSGALTGQQQIDLTSDIATYKGQISMLDDVISRIGDRDDITGPVAGSIGMAANRRNINVPFINSDTSAEYKAATSALQLMMQDLKVKGILDNTKNTKGAISDKEMALFASGVPSIDIDQEGVWKQWLQERRDAYARIVYRLENGIRIDSGTGQILSQNGQAYTGKQPEVPEYTTITGPTTSSSTYTVSPEIEAEFNAI